MEALIATDDDLNAGARPGLQRKSKTTAQFRILTLAANVSRDRINFAPHWQK
jgi:hypothetical protein